MPVVQTSINAMPTIVEHRTLRLSLIFLLYVAQGMPIGIFLFALPAWLAADGATALEIGGLVSAATLPWSLKFVNGFVMDRFAWLPMGRRRPWLIVAQSGIVLGLLAFAAVNPDRQALWLLSVFAFVINLATTFQDVAIDGMAVDLVPAEERARANGMMFGGQSIGIWVGTAGAGYMLASRGLPTTMTTAAVLVLMILMLLLLFRERPGEKSLPWMDGCASQSNVDKHAGAWKPILTTTLRALLDRQSLKLLICLFLHGSIYGIYLGVQPLVATNEGGWSDASFSSLSGSGNLLAGVLGVAVFGYIAERLTARRTMMIGAGAMGGLAVVFGMLSDYWSVKELMVVYVLGHLSMYTMSQISVCSTAMGHCHPAVSATQFTIYMAIANMGISSAAAMLGVFNAIGGYQAMYIAIGLAGLLMVIAGAVFRSAFDPVYESEP